MASLAPGNGWFPHRSYGSLRANAGNAVRSQPVRASRNVPAVRFAGDPAISPAAAPSVRTTISAVLDLFLIEDLKTGRAASQMLTWGVVATVLAIFIWVGCMSAYVGGAVALDVPWTTLTVAMTAVHILAAILIVLLCVRHGRKLLESAKQLNPVVATE